MKLFRRRDKLQQLRDKERDQASDLRKITRRSEQIQHDIDWLQQEQRLRGLRDD